MTTISTTSRRRGARTLAALALALAACGDDGPQGSASGATDASATGGESDTDGGTDTDTGGEAALLLTPTEHLVRVSMALRGRRPSDGELAAVAADPAALPGIVDAYLESPEFGAIIRDLHNDALLSIVDFGAPPAGFAPKQTVAGADPYALNRAIMEAPLRLIEKIVREDRPYGEIVTAPYTLADEHVAGVWGIAHSGAPGSWEESHWTDGRAEAGVLSDSWLFVRHSSTVSNAGRGRANAMARAFLCYDFLDRDIVLDPSVNLADPNAVAAAVQENPSCAACHQALDPMATFFSGYLPDFVPAIVPYPLDMWVEGLFTDLFKVNLREPGFFGAPGEDLADLGAMIADDPRFSLCAARRFYAYFHQVELRDVPLERASELQAILEASGMRVKAMVRELVLADDFKVADGERGWMRARPPQLAALFADLTGFRWRTDLSAYGIGVIDLMDDTLIGYHVLAGGIDSLFVARPSYTYSATSSLALQSLARQAANFVVDADFAQDDPAARRLLRAVSEQDTGEAVIRDQLVDLHRRLYGVTVAADDPSVSDAHALFLGALAAAPGDVRRAWKTTLSALLQDVRIAFY